MQNFVRNLLLIKYFFSISIHHSSLRQQAKRRRRSLCGMTCGVLSLFCILYFCFWQLCSTDPPSFVCTAAVFYSTATLSVWRQPHLSAQPHSPYGGSRIFQQAAFFAC
jgi:hypothetical protein